MKQYLAMFVFALAGTSAMPAVACRELPLDRATQGARIVALGVVSSVSIPALEKRGLTRNDEIGLVLAGAERRIRISVRESRVGKAPAVISMKTQGMCDAWQEVGEDVIVFRFADGPWQIRPVAK
jgi:hypothetical protein